MPYGISSSQTASFNIRIGNTNQQTTLSWFIWGEAENATNVRGSNNAEATDQASGTGGTTPEKFNSRSAATTSTSATATLTLSGLVIQPVLIACNYIAWRADYRRGLVSNGSGAGCSVGIAGSVDRKTVQIDYSEDMPNNYIARNVRRNRSTFFTMVDCNNHFHKKTGGGAFELTSLPHNLNDGITWADTRSWRLGNNNTEFWSINIYGTHVPTTYTQDLTGVLSFIGNFIYPWRQTATLSYSGAFSKQTNKPFTGTLSFIGAFIKQTLKSLAGTLSFAGT